MRKRVKWLDYWIIGGLSKSWDFINPSLLWEVFRILSLVIMPLKMSSKATPFNISLRIRENSKELLNHLIFLLEFNDASAFILFEFRFKKQAKRPWVLWLESSGIFTSSYLILPLLETTTTTIEKLLCHYFDTSVAKELFIYTPYSRQ